MRINEPENSDQKDLLTNFSKKEWIKPVVEVIGHNSIKSGTATSYAEGVPTPYSFAFGVS